MIKVKELKPWSEVNEVLKECSYSEDYENAVIDYLRNNKLVFCGDTHQGHTNEKFKGVPVFNDNTCFLGSMRFWGRVMSRATGHGDYMDYYMTINGRDPIGYGETEI